uniref:Uncharacterized protein n=1 Tax=Leersia perrieri TaxID=77586 RepID=A0A0D9W0I2_9ORYZ
MFRCETKKSSTSATNRSVRPRRNGLAASESKHLNSSLFFSGGVIFEAGHFTDDRGSGCLLDTIFTH